MAGSINEFKSSFTKDLARANRFDVFVPIPLVLLPYFKSTRTLKFRCESAQLPGKSFATIEQKFGSAPVEKFPYMTNYQDIDLTFLIDDDMQQKLLFDGWMNYISPVYNFNFRYKSNDLSPYKSAAYYFINSLPLATLREKYKTQSSSTDLDYIVSTIKKFGGIHRLPYAWILKYGSIWHRYKTWNRKGVDILDDSWKDFNYKGNYDPVNSATTKTYSLNINNLNRKFSFFS
jgi:hypothetical protein